MKKSITKITMKSHIEYFQENLMKKNNNILEGCLIKVLQFNKQTKYMKCLLIDVDPDNINGYKLPPNMKIYLTKTYYGQLESVLQTLIDVLQYRQLVGKILKVDIKMNYKYSIQKKNYKFVNPMSK